MAMVRGIRVAALMALAFALAGCGAKNEASSSLPSGAEFAPASSVVYVAGVTDPSSEQWEKADALLSRFPGRAKAIASFKKDLAEDGLTWEGDLKPALGDDLNLVLLSYDDADHNYVFFTKPHDEAKMTKVLESGKPADRQVHRKIDGWTVFADNEKSLDNFAAARASGNALSDDDAFKDAMNDMSDEAAIRGYLPGQPIVDAIKKEAAKSSDTQQFKSLSESFGKLRYVAFSSTAEDEGVSVQAAYETAKEMDASSYRAELDSTLPSGALFYASFSDLEQNFDRVLKNADEQDPQFEQQLNQFQQALGFSLKDDVLPLFSKEGALAVYAGKQSVPVVTLALRVDDETKATQLINRLAAIAGLAGITVQPLSIEGAQGKAFLYPEDDLTINAVVGEGKLLVSNSRQSIQDALGDAKKLSDDAVYQEARDASSVPDETSGFAYVNLKQALPLLFGLGDAMSESDSPEAIPPDVRANTKPLQSVLLYTKQDGKRATISGFLTIK
jgi:hypothetical protein